MAGLRYMPTPYLARGSRKLASGSSTSLIQEELGLPPRLLHKYSVLTLERGLDAEQLQNNNCTTYRAGHTPAMTKFLPAPPVPKPRAS